GSERLIYNDTSIIFEGFNFRHHIFGGSQSRVFLIEKDYAFESPTLSIPYIEEEIDDYENYQDCMILKCAYYNRSKTHRQHYYKRCLDALSMDVFIQTRGPLVGTPLAIQNYGMVRTPSNGSIDC